MLIMKHVHHPSTEMEDKKDYNMPTSTPTDMNQVNPTTIIDGSQRIKVDFSRFNQLMQNMQLCNMAELRKRKWNPR